MGKYPNSIGKLFGLSLYLMIVYLLLNKSYPKFFRYYRSDGSLLTIQPSDPISNTYVQCITCIWV